MKIGIVVLNYNNYLCTYDCVDYLIKTNIDKIVIVDNCSTNESYERLLNRYLNNKQVEVTKTSKNLGYARGMNYGINRLKTFDVYDFIGIFNNDLNFENVDFFKVLSNCMNYDLVSLELLNTDGSIQKPTGIFKKTPIFHLIKTQIYCFVNTIKNVFGIKIVKKPFLYDEKQIIISGPCFFLSKKFINTYGGLYYGTFMYNEEFNLYTMLRKKKGETKYIRGMKITHLEGASDIGLKKISNKKLRLIFVSSIKSIPVLWKKPQSILKYYKKAEKKYV